MLTHVCQSWLEQVKGLNLCDTELYCVPQEKSRCLCSDLRDLQSMLRMEWPVKSAKTCTLTLLLLLVYLLYWFPFQLLGHRWNAALVVGQHVSCSRALYTFQFVAVGLGKGSHTEQEHPPGAWSLCSTIPWFSGDKMVDSFEERLCWGLSSCTRSLCDGSN